MNSFSDFNIKAASRAFVGKKIILEDILDKEIIIHDYKIGPSKIFVNRGSGKCLCLQLSFNGQKRILFTGGTALIEMIEKVPKDGFPFKTKIIQEDKLLNFI